MFTSSTTQPSHRDPTFTGVALHDGSVITSERRGRRAATKKKGLVVRYGVSGPEVLHEATEGLDGIAVTDEGVIHVISATRHRVLEPGGRWRNVKLIEKELGLTKHDAQLQRVFVLGDSTVLFSLFRPGSSTGPSLVDGQYELVEHGPDEDVRGLAGRSHDDFFVSTAAGLQHCDGTTLRTIAPGWTGTLALHDDRVLLCGVIDGRRAIGSVRAEGEATILLDLDGLGLSGTPAEVGSVGPDVVFTLSHGEDRGLYDIEGRGLAKLTGLGGHLACDDTDLVVDNGVELLRRSSGMWSTVRRALDTEGPV
jgi:hypothetical protein